MLKWLWENSTPLAAFGGLLFGLIGMVLSVWNRLEQASEARRKRRENEPRASIKTGWMSDDGSGGALISMWNPGRDSLVITGASILRPAGMVISPTDRPYNSIQLPTGAARSISLNWLVPGASAKSPGVASEHLWVLTAVPRDLSRSPYRPEGEREIVEYLIQFTGTDTSARRRKFKMLATAAKK